MPSGVIQHPPINPHQPLGIEAATGVDEVAATDSSFARLRGYPATAVVDTVGGEQQLLPLHYPALAAGISPVI
ncbi:hypothetical protein D3C80_743460 [compost metagenome]